MTENEAMASRAKVVEERDEAREGMCRLDDLLHKAHERCYALLSSIARLENASNVRDSERVTENAKLREALQAVVDRVVYEGSGDRKALELAAALGVKPGGA